MDAAMHDRGSRAYTFLSSRLHAIAGYLDRPTISAGMRFVLPTGFKVASSRFIALGSKLMEIWSPNSNQTPFYPGLRESTFKAGRRLPTEYRRSDSHAGRFDPTVSPQHFDPSLPWLGFIKRPYDTSLPEFANMLSHWEPSGSGNKGTFRLEFITALKERFGEVYRKMESRSGIERISPTLWKDRPESRNDPLSIIRGELTFDDAIDNLAYLQVEIKFMDAWTRMADAINKASSTPTPLHNATEGADETLIGIWLNDVTETTGLRMLRFQVPCFIVSEVLNAEDITRANGRPKAMNFVNGTPVAGMNKSLYSIDNTILQAGGTLRDMDADIGISSSAPVFSTLERDRASPTTQLRLSGTSGHQAPPNILSTSTTCEIIPPPVPTVGSGKWSLWSISNLDNEDYTECMEQLGVRRKENKGKYRYFDRQRLRYLCFDSKVPIPERYLADPNVFGIPVPKLLFVQRENNKNLASRTASTWMYLSEKPDPKDINRVYVPSKEPPAQNQADNLMDTSPDHPISSKHPRSPISDHFSMESSSPLQAPPRSPPHKRRTTVVSRSFGSSTFSQHQPNSQRPSLINRLRSPPPRRMQGDYYRPRSRSPSEDYYQRSLNRNYSSGSYHKENSRRTDTYRPHHTEDLRSRSQTRSNSKRRSLSPPIFSSRVPSPPHRQPPRSPYGNRARLLGKSRDTSMDERKREHYDYRSRSRSRRQSRSRSRSRSRPRSHSRSSKGSKSDHSDPHPPNDRPYVTPAPATVVSQTQSGGLSFTTILASSASAVVPYVPSFPQGAELERIQTIFSIPTEPPIPVLSVIAPKAQTSCLTIWNLPAAFVWRNVVQWILMVLPMASTIPPVLERVLRHIAGLHRLMSYDSMNGYM